MNKSEVRAKVPKPSRSRMLTKSIDDVGCFDRKMAL
jgi:hypothetical protein